MKIAALPLAGCYRITPHAIGDARGRFARVFCEDTFATAGLNIAWPQCNMSVSVQTGTLRGMHMQRAEAAETKLIRCVAGAALDVLVDLRKGSATFGQWCAVEISADNLNMVYAAPGCAHGFQTLAPDTQLMYFHSARYAPEHEAGVHYADPDIGIDWPMRPSVISPRDSALPALKDVKPF